MKTPLVLVEEHHEVYAVWQRYFQEFSFGANTQLLHVDQHVDLEVPILRRDFPALDSPLPVVLQFVHEELTIDGFLLAALSQGFFGCLHWLCPDLENNPIAQKRFIASSKSHRLDFITGLHGTKMKALAGNRYSQFDFTADSDLSTLKSHDEQLVLDIDIDYFACHARPRPAFSRLEIPESAYREFRDNHYQPFRLSFGSGVRAKEENGRFYLCFYESWEAPEAPENEVAFRAQIDKRIASFLEHFASKKREPRLITIARSRISGYTRQYEYIEKKLRAGLSILCDTEPLTIEDL